MKKFNKVLILTLIVSLLGVTPVFALSQEELAVRTQKEQLVVEKIKTTTNLTPMKGNYISNVKFVDKFGNHLRAYTQWNGNGFVIADQFDKPFGVSFTATREGYKSAKVNFKVDKAGKVSKAITLEPSKVNNIVMGTVKFPEGTDKKGWYIQVTDMSKKKVDAETAYIRVQDNGTFKMYNLANGTYKFTVVKAIANDPQEYTASFGSEVIKVNGNVNKAFEFKTEDYVDILDATEIFNKVDYSNPQAFVYENDDFLELTPEWKKLADEKISNGKDLKALKEINDLVQSKSNRHTAPTDGDSISAKEIISQGYTSGCLQFGTIFQALANYKGIPTRYIFALEEAYISQVRPTGNFGGVFVHVFIEAFVDGKWVLIDSTGTPIIEDYDKDDNNIITDFGHYYIVGNLNTGEGLGSDISIVNINSRVAMAMDMSLFSKETKNNMVK